MIAKPYAFTASGKITEGGDRVYVCGGSINGFDHVNLYDGNDNTGLFIARMQGNGEHHFGYEIIFTVGLYAEVSGSGVASVWIV